jgi:hypothetical protein
MAGSGTVNRAVRVPVDDTSCNDKISLYFPFSNPPTLDLLSSLEQEVPGLTRQSISLRNSALLIDHRFDLGGFFHPISGKRHCLNHHECVESGAITEIPKVVGNLLRERIVVECDFTIHANPRPVLQPEETYSLSISTLGGARGTIGRPSQIIRGFGLNDSLVRDGFCSVGLIFHPFSEVFHPFRLFAGGISLLPGLHREIVRVSSTTVHFNPLKAYEHGSHERHHDGSSSPSNGGALKSVHLALSLLELFCGGWALCRGTDALGYLSGRQLHIGYVYLLFGGVLFIHGGVLTAQAVVEILGF